MITSSKTRAALLAIAASATLALSACSVGAPRDITDSPEPVADIATSISTSSPANGSPQGPVDDDCEWDADDREWDDCDDD